MKISETKRLSHLLEKADLTLKQEWRIRDFINDVEDRAFAEGYRYFYKLSLGGKNAK
jgi:hypothetical protein